MEMEDLSVSLCSRRGLPVLKESRRGRLQRRLLFLRGRLLVVTHAATSIRRRRSRTYSLEGLQDVHSAPSIPRNSRTPVATTAGRERQLCLCFTPPNVDLRLTLESPAQCSALRSVLLLHSGNVPTPSIVPLPPQPFSYPGTPSTELSPELFRRLPQHYHPQSRITSALAAILLQPFLPREIAGLDGPCGCGKTTTALAVALSPSVQRKFCGRVFFLSVGRGCGHQPLRLLLLLQILADQLYRVAFAPQGCSPPGNKLCLQRPCRFQSVDQALNWISEAVSSVSGPRDEFLRCLVVLDDVWELQVIKALWQTQCVLLVTTPLRDRLRGIGAEWVSMPLSPGEAEAAAIASAASATYETVPKSLPQAMDLQVSPLVLCQLVAVAARLGLGWNEVQPKLAQAGILARATSSSLDVSTPHLLVTTASAMVALDAVRADVDPDLYYALSVLPQGFRVPSSVLGIVWGKGDDSHTVAGIIQALVSVLLLRCDSSITEGGVSYYYAHEAHELLLRAKASQAPSITLLAQQRLKDYLSSLPALMNSAGGVLQDSYGGNSRYALLDSLWKGIGSSLDAEAPRYLSALNLIRRNDCVVDNVRLAIMSATVADALAATGSCGHSSACVGPLADLKSPRESVEGTALKEYERAATLLKHSLDSAPHSPGRKDGENGTEEIVGQQDGQTRASQRHFYSKLASMWSGLAEAMAKAGNTAYARQLFQRAVELYTFCSSLSDTPGLAVIDVAFSCVNELGCLLAVAGAAAREGHHNRAREVGQEHPILSDLLLNLTRVRTDPARSRSFSPLSCLNGGIDQIFKRSLAIFITVLGPNHPFTSKAMDGITSPFEDDSDVEIMSIASSDYSAPTSPCSPARVARTSPRHAIHGGKYFGGSTASSADQSSMSPPIVTKMDLRPSLCGSSLVQLVTRNREQKQTFMHRLRPTGIIDFGVDSPSIAHSYLITVAAKALVELEEAGTDQGSPFLSRDGNE
jgi:hypothetical protein